jgi:hypothetical protein
MDIDAISSDWKSSKVCQSPLKFMPGGLSDFVSGARDDRMQGIGCMNMDSPKLKHATFATRALTAASVLVAALAIGLSVVGGVPSSAQPILPAPSQQLKPPAPPVPQVPPDLPKIYLPGLGEFMQAVQIHHAKLWLAARARNWALADYQLSEMKEVLDEVRELVPTYKNVPVGQMVDAITTGPIAELEKAVEEKKFGKFAASYDKLTEACNSCHMAASRGFIKIRRPTRSTFENQEFRPARR